MDPTGPPLAEGRDSVIYEHGEGRVLRLAKDGRSLVREADVMSYAREHGVPVPAVHDAGEGYLVMDRVDGPTLLDTATRPPFRIAGAGRELARLHRLVHAAPAPDWLPAAPLPGDRLLHGDLHPLNVIVGPDGPVVIDWTNARRGDPAYDVADIWAMIIAADPPVKPVERVGIRLFRPLFLRAFLGALDRGAAERALPVAAEARFWDRNLSDVERGRLVALVERLRVSDRGR